MAMDGSIGPSLRVAGGQEHDDEGKATGDSLRVPTLLNVRVVNPAFQGDPLTTAGTDASPPPAPLPFVTPRGPRVPDAADRLKSASSSTVSGSTLDDRDDPHLVGAAPRCCVGNTIGSTILLMGMFVEIAAYLLMQITPMLDPLAEEEEARRWIGVTPTVEVFVGILCLPALALCVFVAVRITCRFHRTVREARAQAHLQVQMRSTSLTGLLVSCCDFFSGPHSPYVFVVIYLSELNELFWQALAIEQMSRHGIGRTPLLLYTTVVLTNSVTPIILMRIQRATRTRSMAAKEIGRWLARILLIDAAGDLLYSSFLLWHFVGRFLSVYYLDREVNDHVTDFASQFHNIENTGDDINAFIIQAEGTTTMFGGESVGDGIVKFLSRVLPLFLAAARVHTAVITRHTFHHYVQLRTQRSLIISMSKGGKKGRIERINRHLSNASSTASSIDGDGRRMQPHVSSGAESSTTTQFDGIDIPRQLTSQKSLRQLIRSRIGRTVRRAATSQTLGQHYIHVPAWAIIILSATTTIFCFTVYLLLAFWGECPIPEVAESCVASVIRDSPLRGCACSSLVFIDQKCAAIGNSSADTASTAAATTTSNFTLLKHASEVLNHTAILQDTRGLFLRTCQEDEDILQTLMTKADNLVNLQLLGVEQQQTTGLDGSLVHRPPAWEFPDGFGQKASSSSEQDVWPLQVFYTASLRLKALPPTLASFTGLLELRSIAAGLTSVPDAFGKLTKLRAIALKQNLLTALPAGISDLGPSLIRLYLLDNHLKHLPAELGRLTNLRALQATNNSLTTIPAPILTLPQPLYLNVEENNISRVTFATALSAAGAPAMDGDTPRSLLLVGRNPYCDSSSMVPTDGFAGRMEVRCEPECALGCISTKTGLQPSWLGDGECDFECRVEACQFDGGDCSAA